MYKLPMLTHLEVVALGGRSDISPDQHLNYASNPADKRKRLCGRPGEGSTTLCPCFGTLAEADRRAADERSHVEIFSLPLRAAMNAVNSVNSPNSPGTTW